TVSDAIEQLIAEGFLESRVGSGTYVVANVVKPTHRKKPPALQLPPNARRFDATSATIRTLALGDGPLRAGIPDVTSFPTAIWARITRRKLAEFPRYLEYFDARGEPELRSAIAAHVRQFRGVTTDPDLVVVVEGTQAAARLVADVLLAEGDGAVIEDPGYPFLRMALEPRGVRLLAMPVDRDGISVTNLPKARLAFVCPSHQYPLGVQMSFERRRALLAWSLENDAYVVEDDYDSEFAFEGKPLPTMHSIDRRERVIYIGTFSKTLAPALRLAYLVVPPHLADVFQSARVASALGGTRYVQATLADFVAEGHFARYVRRMTGRYDERRRALLAVLRDGLRGCDFTVEGVDAGLHLAIVGPPDFDDRRVARELSERGVHVQPLSEFCIARTDCRGFVLGYGAAPLTDVLDAAKHVVAACRAATESQD
ncbi:MAG: PLP-dependent aminotransferase family protein, partial [Candidatus Eremiobacteraeota bacterium]|nr:PLP-dependent aminotransferase family protein [Candidatus Eremiobacteraeota bacterium]